MTNEGVALLSRAAVIAVLIFFAALFRVLIGTGTRSGHFMLAGTLGGISLGVGVASLISPWTRTDLSVICATAGIIVGWCVAWLFARRTFRSAR